MSILTTNQKDKLMGDFSAVIQDSEELLKATAHQAGESTTALRERARLRLESAKHSLQDLQQAAIEKAKAASHKADDYAHEHPWHSVGIAAGIGLLLGILISRR